MSSFPGKVFSHGVLNAAGAIDQTRGAPDQPPAFPTPGYGSGGKGPGGTFSTTPPPITKGAPVPGLPNLDQTRNAKTVPPEIQQAPDRIRPNMICADCDPQGGGGGGGNYPSG